MVWLILAIQVYTQLCSVVAHWGIVLLSELCVLICLDTYFYFFRSLRVFFVGRLGSAWSLVELNNLWLMENKGIHWAMQQQSKNDTSINIYIIYVNIWFLKQNSKVNIRATYLLPHAYCFMLHVEAVPRLVYSEPHSLNF